MSTPAVLTVKIFTDPSDLLPGSPEQARMAKTYTDKVPGWDNRSEAERQLDELIRERFPGAELVRD